MKKILFISLNDHVPWGGSEELWSKTALLMTKDNHIAVLKKRWTEEHKCIRDIEAHGGKVYYKPLPVSNTNKSIISKLLSITKGSIKQQNDLDVVKDIETYDLIILSVGSHIDSKIVNYANYLKQYGIPYVIVVQLATSLKYIDDNQIEKLKVAYEDAIGIGYLSNENLEVLETQLGLTLQNTFKINNPFNFEQSYLKPNFNETYQIANVAAYTILHKGQDLLLKVLSQKKWKQRNVCFNLYGGGINKNHLQSLIKLYNIEHLVKLKGHEADKQTIWELNHALIMPSRMEGQSLAMLEAMSFGRMVISTKVGAAEELIEDNRTGFLAQAATVQLIDEALERAWDSRKQWIDMGRLSREKLYKMIPEEPVRSFSKGLKMFLR